MIVYVVRNMNADSWSGLTWVDSIFTTEEKAVEKIQSKHNFTERPVNESLNERREHKVVRDFFYYRIERWEIQ